MYYGPYSHGPYIYGLYSSGESLLPRAVVAQADVALLFDVVRVVRVLLLHQLLVVPSVEHPVRGGQ